MAHPNGKLTKGSAQLVLWFKGLPQPTAFLLAEAEALRAKEDFEAERFIRFQSFNDGSGVRSDSCFACSDLRGVTVEYNTIQIVGN